MKKVILTIVTAVALMSCSKEEQVRTELDTFTGVYQLEKLIRIDNELGEVIVNTTFDCPNIWTFEDFNLNKRFYQLQGEECVYKYMSDISYSGERTGILTIGSREFEILYIEDFIVLKELVGGATREQYTLTQL